MGRFPVSHGLIFEIAIISTYLLAKTQNEIEPQLNDYLSFNWAEPSLKIDFFYKKESNWSYSDLVQKQEEVLVKRSPLWNEKTNREIYLRKHKESPFRF